MPVKLCQVSPKSHYVSLALHSDPSPWKGGARMDFLLLLHNLCLTSFFWIWKALPTIYPWKRFVVGKKQYAISFLALHDAYILRDWHVPFVHHVDKKNNSYAGIEHKYESINVSARAAAGLRLAHFQPLLDQLLSSENEWLDILDFLNLYSHWPAIPSPRESPTVWQRGGHFKPYVAQWTCEPRNRSTSLYQCRHKLIIRIVG